MLSLSLVNWSIVIFCGILIGMSKTGIGGVATLVVPLMAGVFGGMPSSGIVLPMLIMADVFGVVYYHRNAEWSYIIKLAPWALAGVVIGLVFGKHISAPMFKSMIAYLILVSLPLLIWLETRKKTDIPSNLQRFAPVFGILGGFSTMIGNAAGPIMSVYMLSANLPKNNYIGTTAWFFMLINLSKLPLQIWGWHNITLQSLGFNLCLLPAIALGAFLGIRLVKVFSDKKYRWFILAATFVSALMMII